MEWPLSLNHENGPSLDFMVWLVKLSNSIHFGHKQYFHICW